MPLTSSGLSALVFVDHLSAFPLAINAVRENSDTGVPRHNIQDAFIGALCSAYVTSLKSMSILDLGVGVLGVPPGSAVPVPFSFPGARAATSSFLLASGWTGRSASKVADSYITNVLVRTSQLGLLQMKPNLLMAIGSGVVSPISNASLYAAMYASLSATLPAQFASSGKFCAGDVPGSVVNETLLPQFPLYANALALGTASMVATVAYVGSVGATAPVAGAVNSGSII